VELQRRTAGNSGQLAGNSSPRDAGSEPLESLSGPRCSSGGADGSPKSLWRTIELA